MRKPILVALLVCLALSTSVQAQKVIIGEHIEHQLDTPHPYTKSGSSSAVLTWSDHIVFPGATYIAVHFSRFELAPGDYAVVRSADGLQKWVYRDRGRQNLGVSEDGFFATHIKGEEAFIDLYTSGTGAGFGYSIDKYGRGYNDDEIEIFWEQGLGEKMNLPYPARWTESICTSNDTDEAKCYNGGATAAAYDTSRAVARLTLNGNAHCTGWLVGNEGHLMTNEHCITSQTQTNSIDFEFMAEGASCATNCASALACPGVIEASGGTFVTDDSALDYALVIPDTSTGTNTDLPATYGFLRLRPSGAVLDERIYIPQHPAGWGKHIAMESTYADDVALGGFNYATSLNETPCSGGPGDLGYWADTQGGSSGSPVISFADNRVVAIHHCRGSAFCSSGNPGSDDRNRGVPIGAIIDDLGDDLPAGAVCEPPSDPSSLSASANGDNQIDLSWTASAPPGPITLTYNVYRAYGTCATPDGPFELIASGVTTNAYSDTTASGGISHAYEVRAFIGETECESQASSCSEATTTGACTRPPEFGGVQTAASAGSVGCGVTLTWNEASEFCAPVDGPTARYNVYRATATEGTFAPIATCVTSTTYTDDTVTFGTEYRYIVRAEDQSGAGAGPCDGGNEEGNDVELSATPAGPDLVVFADDLEAGDTNFTATAGPNDGAGTTPWGLDTAASNSPTTSFFVEEQDSVKDEVLATASAMTIGPGAVLEFWHDHDTEATFDGGVLEYSTNGTTWNDINDTPDRFLEGGYNSTLSSGFSNPLPNRDAWSGDSNGWVRVQVDLSDFNGQSLFFRWRFGCDSSVSDVGWRVDDIRVFSGSSCGELLFTDGFESSNTSAWSGTVP